MPYLKQLANIISDPNLSPAEKTAAAEKVLKEARTQHPAFDINGYIDNGSFNVLHFALLSDDESMTNWLLNNGADINKLTQEKPPRSCFELCIKVKKPNEKLAYILLQYMLATNNFQMLSYDVPDSGGLTWKDHIFNQGLASDTEGEGLNEYLLYVKMIAENQKVSKVINQKEKAVEILFKNLHSAILGKDIKSIKEHLENARKNPDFDINALDGSKSTLLGLAIRAEHYDACQLLIQAGADVNKPSQGTSVLEQAVGLLDNQNTSFAAVGALKSIVPLLINNKANFTQLYSLSTEKASILAWLAKSVRLNDLTHLDPKVRDLMAAIRDIILLGHRFDLAKVMDYHGHAINLEGLFVGTACESVLGSYEKFAQNPKIRQQLNVLMNEVHDTQDKRIDYFNESNFDKDVATHIQIALSAIGQPLDSKQALELLNSGQLLAIPLETKVRTGYHAISYLFLDNLCIRVNTGASAKPQGAEGIMIMKVGDPKALRAALPRLLNSSKNRVNDDYLMGKFVTDCRLEEIFTIKLPHQKVGNCTIKTNEALVQAVITLEIYKNLLGPAQMLGSTMGTNKETIQYLCFCRAEVLARKWQAMFIAYDRDIALKEAEKFKESIPKSLLAQMVEGKDQAERNQTPGQTVMLSQGPRTLPISKTEINRYYKSVAGDSKSVIEDLNLGNKNDAVHGFLRQLYATNVVKTPTPDLFILTFANEADAKKFNDLMCREGVFRVAKKTRPAV